MNDAGKIYLNIVHTGNELCIKIIKICENKLEKLYLPVGKRSWFIIWMGTENCD